MIDIDEVLVETDALYVAMREEQGRPQTRPPYGIQSSQIQALAKALVDALNRELKKGGFI